MSMSMCESSKTLDELEIADQFNQLLKEREYNPIPESSRKLIELWHKRKQDLIDILSKYPDWDEKNLAISYPMEVIYTTDKAVAHNEFIEFIQRRDFSAIANSISDILKTLLHSRQSVLDDALIKKLESAVADSCGGQLPFKLRKGQKLSRFFKRLSDHLELSKADGFESKFAALSDAFNAKSVTYRWVLSVHPLDYMLMSNGSGWNTCHDIDYYRGGDVGASCAGTLSYMLDSTSMVAYTLHENVNSDFVQHRKVSRQMFFYGKGTLGQSRMYPNSTGVFADLSEKNRGAVQSIISQSLGLKNTWLLSRKQKRREQCLLKGDGSRQFPDYTYSHSTCSISFHKTLSKNFSSSHIEVGAPALCVHCLSPLNFSEGISCCLRSECCCESCGDTIDEDDSINLCGFLYCTECCFLCMECGDAAFVDDIQEVYNDRYRPIDICPNCFHDCWNCQNCGYMFISDCRIHRLSGGNYCGQCYSELTKDDDE